MLESYKKAMSVPSQFKMFNTCETSPPKRASMVHIIKPITYALRYEDSGGGRLTAETTGVDGSH